MINKSIMLIAGSLKPNIIEEASVFELMGGYIILETILKILIPIVIVAVIILIKKKKNKIKDSEEHKDFIDKE